MDAATNRDRPVTNNGLVSQVSELKSSLEQVKSNRTTYILGIFARSKPSKEQIDVNNKLSELHEGMRFSIKEIKSLESEIKKIKNSNLPPDQKQSRLNSLNQQLITRAKSQEALAKEINEFKVGLKAKGMNWSGQAKLTRSVTKDLKKLSSTINNGLIASDPYLNRLNEMRNEAKNILLTSALETTHLALDQDQTNNIKDLREKYNQLLEEYKGSCTKNDNPLISGMIKQKIGQMEADLKSLESKNSYKP